MQLAFDPFPPMATGEVGSHGASAVAILPHSGSAGALEDLLLNAISGDPSLPCVDDLLSCVASRSGLSWPAQYVSKARLNVWLGSRADPRHTLRSAISAGLFPMSHQAFGPIRAFLTQLAAAAEAS